MRATKWMLLLFVMHTCMTQSNAQKNDKHVVRLARLVIDSAQLETYNRMLKEGIETAIKVEPGVLTLYAVAEKERPTHITILEIYADADAYEKHIKTPHFMKY